MTLYSWLEYGIPYTIRQEGSQKWVWGHLGGAWRRLRKMSDSEYALLYADLAAALDRGMMNPTPVPPFAEPRP